MHLCNRVMRREGGKSLKELREVAERRERGRVGGSRGDLSCPCKAAVYFCNPPQNS